MKLVELVELVESVESVESGELGELVKLGDVVGCRLCWFIVCRLSCVVERLAFSV